LFFSASSLSLELLGVFKIKRGICALESYDERSYDSISIRIEGTGHFKTKDCSYTVEPGDIIYLPQNIHYHQETRGEIVLVIHFINYSFHNKNTVEMLRVENNNYVISIIEEMYENWKEKKQGYGYKCLSLLYSLLYYLHCQAHDNIIDSVNPDGKLKTALDYIHSHFRHEQISIPKLAAMCTMSETYFRKQFKAVYSVSPTQYILNLRLEYSSQLLRSRLYSISEVSEKSGFNDVKYFRKLFKKYFHYTPREYRNIIPEKDWN